MNISNFFSWFLTQFVKIGKNMLDKLDNIYLIGNVSLLDFTITITIIGIFLNILLTIPQNLNRKETRAERRARKEKNDN